MDGYEVIKMKNGYVGELVVKGLFTLYVKELIKGEPEYLVIDCFINGSKVGRRIKYRIYYRFGRGYIVKDGVRYFMSEFKFNPEYLRNLFK